MHNHDHTNTCACGDVHKSSSNTCEAADSNGGSHDPSGRRKTSGKSCSHASDTGDDNPSHHQSSSCDCGDTGDACCGGNEDKDEFKISAVRLSIAGVLFAAGMFLPESIAGTAAFILSYIVAGYTVLLSAVKNFFARRAFDETLLMTIATLGAAALGDFAEAAAVMILFGIGELLQSLAVGSTKRSISALLDLKPDEVHRLADDVLQTVEPGEVAVGDVIVVKPYERIPLDGIVIDGSSQVDTSALTGESVPVAAGADTFLFAGGINGDGALTINVSAAYADSAVSKIIKMTEEAGRQKSPREKFITRFARIYTPAVVGAAALICIVPPLLLGMGTFQEWLYTALTLLVISCPCALVISVPLAFFAGLGGASRNGILIKGSTGLEALAKTRVVAFDKTGTLTKGEFTVTAVMPENGVKADALIEICALAESMSTHPIGRSLAAYYNRPIVSARVSGITEPRGRGIQAKVDGKTVLAGKPELLADNGILIPGNNTPGSVVHVACDGRYMGYIAIGDTLKEDSAETVESLKGLNIKTVMLTGDTASAADPIAEKLGIDEYYAGLLPGGKVEYIAKLKGEAAEQGGSAVFVGDGINDAPVIAAADVGVSMGGLGSDAAIEASDVVLMTDKPKNLISGIKSARKTLRIVSQNITIALGIKALVMIFSLLVMPSMWLAVIADTGSALLAVANSVRALKGPKD